MEIRQRTRATPVTTEPVQTRTRIRGTAAPMPTKTAIGASTSVIITHKENGQETPIESNTQQFPVDVPEVHGTIHVGGKATIKVNEGLWVSISVGIWWPCEPTEYKANETYAACSEWCERRIQRERDMLSF